MGTLAAYVFGLLPLVLIVVIPTWSMSKVVRGLHTGDWSRPGWFGHAATASLFIGMLAWLWGFLQGGFDTEEVCTVQHHQPYDTAYRIGREFRLFPLSNKCNPHFDLVPAWVNPTVAVFFLLFVVSVMGVVWTTGRRLKQAF